MPGRPGTGDAARSVANRRAIPRRPASTLVDIVAAIPSRRPRSHRRDKRRVIAKVLRRIQMRPTGAMVSAYLSIESVEDNA